MKTFEGSLVASNIKVAIVAARFNEFITSKLIGGAMDGLSRHGVQEADIHLAWVPSSAAAPATMTTSAPRSPRALPPSPSRLRSPFSSAS